MVIAFEVKFSLIHEARGDWTDVLQIVNRNRPGRLAILRRAHILFSEIKIHP